MLTLDFKGNFDRIGSAMDKVEQAGRGTVQTNSVNLTTFGQPDGIDAAAGFEGTFSPISNSGTIISVEVNLVRYSPLSFLLDATFGGFAVSFSSVFTISGGFFTYRESGWASRVTSGDYEVAGGSKSDDILQPTGIFRFDGDDVMRAGSGNDRFSGGAGNDLILGQLGRDTLNGNAGNDVLKGGGGADRLSGEGGRDVLFGGKGRDVFVFSDAGRDRVMDYRDGFDKIEITAAARFRDLDIAETDKGALVSFGNASFLLVGIDAAKLDAGDFIF